MHGGTGAGVLRMIYTEDREQFERDILQPGRFARLLERAGRYLDGLDDKDAFLKAALDVMWERRGEVTDTTGLLLIWDEALRYAASSRPRWLVHTGPALERTKWVPCGRLGRH